MNCKNYQVEMQEALLNPPPTSAVQAHLDACPACRQELASLQDTFALLDTWQAPEPSPYFSQRLAVRLREEQAAPPLNWLERLQTRLLLNTGRQFRPALVGTMALALLIGGGTFASLSDLPTQHDKPSVSATVDDLQILDKNEQAFQEMDQLLQDDSTPDDNSTVPPQS